MIFNRGKLLVTVGALGNRSDEKGISSSSSGTEVQNYFFTEGIKKYDKFKNGTKSLMLLVNKNWRLKFNMMTL